MPRPAAGGAGFLGIVMLDTRFPRPPGDIGHPETFDVPVRRAVVSGAWPDKVVQSAAGLRAARLLQPFVGVVRQLERDGAWAITTSCGFLVLMQKELQAAVKVPLVTSTLTLLPSLLAAEPRVGVLTISASRLGKEHLRSAGVARERLGDVVVQGVAPAGEFARAILGNLVQMDLARAGADVVAAATALKSRAPELRTVVLECTNMPPYAKAIEEATGWRVVTMRDATALFKPFESAA